MLYLRLKKRKVFKICPARIYEKYRKQFRHTQRVPFTLDKIRKPLFPTEIKKQAGTGPSRRHIQGSKIAKRLPSVKYSLLQYSKIEIFFKKKFSKNYILKKMDRVARQEVRRDYYSDSFFLSTRTGQNSSTRVLQNIIAPNCTIWSSELNQKGFSCFSA